MAYAKFKSKQYKLIVYNWHAESISALVLATIISMHPKQTIYSRIRLGYLFSLLPTPTKFWHGFVN